MKIRRAFILALIVLLMAISSCSSLSLEKESESIEPVTIASEDKGSDKYGGEVDASNEEDEPANIPEEKAVDEEESGTTNAGSTQEEENNTFVSKNSTSAEDDDIVKVPKSISIVVTVIFVVILGCAFCFLLYDKKLLFIVIGISCVLYLGYLVFCTDIFCRHAWIEATCENPKTCSKCGKTEGEALGHDVAEFKIIREASCQKAGLQIGKCDRCGKKANQTIPQKEHEPDGKLVITEKATYAYSGKKAEHCLLCGQACNEVTYSLSEREKERDFYNSCKRYSYDTLARYPDTFRGAAVKVAGEVVQVMENGNELQMRVNITKDEYDFYEDTVYVYYTNTSYARILDGDIIAIYGTMLGTVSYTTVLGATMTVPAISAKKIETIGNYRYDSI